MIIATAVLLIKNCGMMQRRNWLFYLDEILNSITHGIGVLLSIAGLVLLLVFAAIQEADTWKVVSFSIYGASLIIMYLASTLYHAFRDRNIKQFLNVFDHASIYVLIAGTYTPFTLVTMRGPWGWSIFGVIWGLAIAGVVYKLFFYNDRYRRLSALLYVFMGCIIVIAIRPLIRNIPVGGLLWLAAGGVLYIGGVFFYLRDKKNRFNHVIWHLFVLAGSMFHFFAIFFYILPEPYQ
jgi:hemolysin III